jgi:BirA family biotin operon repressor/biotin-[acetyl-CoA-carboxylase] ligase
MFDVHVIFTRQLSTENRKLVLMNNQLSQSDTLSAESIKEGLQTSCFGQEVLYLPSTSSTNRVAKEAAQKGMQEGTLIITNHQTEGRGRFDRTWWSSPGKDLLFSLIFRPPLKASQTFRLTLLSSLAVAEAIRQETGLDALIKWPNDVYIKGKKVSGILSESGIHNEHLEYMIVGIGINVNSTPSRNPEIEERATSISMESGKNFPRITLLTVILELIESYYRGIQKGDFHSLKKRWDTLSLINHKKVMVETQGCMHEGTAESIDEDGFLVLLDHTGTKRRIVSGDVSLSLL